MASSNMQGRCLFSMLLPAGVIGGPVVVGGELPNKRQRREVRCQRFLTQLPSPIVAMMSIIARSVRYILPLEQALYMRWDDTDTPVTNELSFSYQTLVIDIWQYVNLLEPKTVKYTRT